VPAGEALLNKMWLQNTMMFGIKGGTENQKLKWSDIALNTDENGQEYLEYAERETKTRTGELSTVLVLERSGQNNLLLLVIPLAAQSLLTRLLEIAGRIQPRPPTVLSTSPSIIGEPPIPIFTTKISL
jgi:hypothetical protein